MAWRKEENPAATLAKKAARAFAEKDWQRAVDFLREIPADKAELVDQALQLLRASIKQNDTNHRLFVLHGLPDDTLNNACQRGSLPYAEALQAIAAFGDAPRLKGFLENAEGVLIQSDLDKGLKAAVIWRDTMVVIDVGYTDRYEHYTSGSKAENVALLLKAGASTEGDNAELLVRAADQNNLAIVKSLVEAGANLSVSGKRAMKKAEERNYDAVALYLREQLIALQRFSMPDEQTLVETKALDDRGSQLRLVFNFAARQVTEIYNGPEEKAAAAMVTHRFADYDSTALTEAFERLKSMGGHPRPLGDKAAHTLPAPPKPAGG